MADDRLLNISKPRFVKRLITTWWLKTRFAGVDASLEE